MDYVMETKQDVKVSYSKEQELNDFISEVFFAAVETFRFSDKEREAFEKNRVSQLIAAIPFLAGCEDAKRTALAHLSVYLTELRGGSIIFDHCKDDNNSVYTRLRLISMFKGGNEEVIHHGMTLLALCMLDGYNMSAKSDLKKGIYNPLNDGSWDYDILYTSLTNEINENPCEAIDTLTCIENGSLGKRWGVGG